MLRIEKGFITHAEIHGRVTAFDIGLEKMVSAKKDCIGKAAAAAPRPVGPRARATGGPEGAWADTLITAGAHLFTPRRRGEARERSGLCHLGRLVADAGRLAGAGLPEERPGAAWRDGPPGRSPARDRRDGRGLRSRCSTTRKGRSSVPDLIAKSPLAGHPPLTLGHGHAVGTAAAAPHLRRALPRAGEGTGQGAQGAGPDLPGARTRSAVAEGARLVWTGRDQAFLIGADPAPLAAHAALTDQSDGWAGLAPRRAGGRRTCSPGSSRSTSARRLPAGRGPRAAQPHVEPPDAHRAGRFEILVFRSMARTAWHEVGDRVRCTARRHRAGAHLHGRNPDVVSGRGVECATRLASAATGTPHRSCVTGRHDARRL